jgi:ribosomal protein S18 acetylase RimI-like enzyme
MVVEELAPDDQEAAADLWQAVDLTRPWNDAAADFARALGGPTSTVLGIRRGARLAGTVMVGHDGHRGWVYYLAVDPAQQRQGLGTHLMAAAEDWLRAHGAVKLQLMVRHSNQATSAFYERLGYDDAEVSVLARWLAGPPGSPRSPA